MSHHRNRKAARLAIKTAELGIAAPLVIAHRLARMATAGPTGNVRDNREFTLMGTEKLAAFYESWNAMFIQAIRNQQAVAASAMRTLWFPWLHAGSFALPKSALPLAALRILSKGLAPVHRRAVANARRLGRSKAR